MHLSTLLKSAAGICRYCGNKAGILSRDHPECKAAYQHSWNRMVKLAAAAARSHKFDEKNLRLTLAEIARNSHCDGATVNQALKEGWKRGVSHAMADGIITQPQENNISDSRERLALDTGSDDSAPPAGNAKAPDQARIPQAENSTHRNVARQDL